MRATLRHKQLAAQCHEWTRYALVGAEEGRSLDERLADEEARQERICATFDAMEEFQPAYEAFYDELTPKCLRPLGEQFGKQWKSFRLVTWIRELPIRMAREGRAPFGPRAYYDQYAWAVEKGEFGESSVEFIKLLAVAYGATHDPDGPGGDS